MQHSASIAVLLAAGLLAGSCGGRNYTKPPRTVPPAPEATSAEARGGQEDTRAEGLTVDGLVEYDRRLFKNRAQGTGTLTISGERITWQNRDQRKRSFSIQTDVVEEATVRCTTATGRKICLELVLSTVTDLSYRFRDPDWTAGENRRILEVRDYLRAHYPSIILNEKAEDKID